MSGTVTAWHNGFARVISETEWTSVCASFLGAGFRVDLPSGPERAEAVEYELGRVRRVADLIGTSFSQPGWDGTAASDPGLHVEVIGGWPRNYAGAPAMWVSARPIVTDRTVATAGLLPARAHPRPTSGLPMFSRLADEVAVTSIETDCGLWADSDGRILTSTAGPVIAQLEDGRWVTGSETRTWLGRRVVAEHRATPELRIDDLEAVRFLGLIRRARGVLPLSYVALESPT